MPKSYAVTAKKGLCLHREIVEDRDEFIHVAAHDIVVDAQKGRIRSAERTEVHLKENNSLELTFCPQYADLGIGKEVRYASATPPVESQS
jgi:hypothetical protein